MNRWSRRACLVTTICALASACSGGSHAAAPSSPSTPPEPTTTTTAPTTTTTAPPPTPPPPPVAPELGLADPTGESLTRPALWVKIENTPEARPQTALDVADVVYEQVTEGG